MESVGYHNSNGSSAPDASIRVKSFMDGNVHVVDTQFNEWICGAEEKYNASLDIVDLKKGYRSADNTHYIFLIFKLVRPLSVPISVDDLTS